MQITKEILDKLPDEVLLALYKNSAEGELQDLFEEEILERMEKGKQPAPTIQQEKPPLPPTAAELMVKGTNLQDVNLPKPKRVLTEAARARISAAQKKRWAKVRKERAAARKK